MGKPARLSDPPSTPEELTAREIDILRRGGFTLEPIDRGAEDPRARTQAAYEDLLRSSLSISEAAARLGVDSGRILQYLTSQPPTLYGIRRGATWVLPDFQFDGVGVIPGFGEIAARLAPAIHPLAVSNWFNLPNSDLPEDEGEERNLSPRDWLRSGRPPAPVAELAADL